MSPIGVPPVMRKRSLLLVIFIEILIIILTAMGIYSLLATAYRRAGAIAGERTMVAQATEIVALLTSMPLPTKSSTETPTLTIKSTATVAPSPTVDATVPKTTAPAPTPSAIGRATVPPSGTRTLSTGSSISRCGPLSTPGSFRLITDLSVSGDCLIVQASNLTLDCDGHSIRGTGKGGIGIVVRPYWSLGAQTPVNVEIRNCRISGFRFGILSDDSKNITLRDNDSSNNFDDVDPKTRYGVFLGMVDGGGIRLNNVTGAQILKNTTNHQAIGIDVRSSTGVSVRENTSSENSAWGISLYSVRNSEVISNTTAGNIRSCTWGAGTVGPGCDAGGIVLQSGSSNNRITGNKVRDGNGNGIFIKAHAQPCGDNNWIVGNTISDVLYNAIEMSFCAGNRANDNVIKNGLDAIWLGYAHDTEIRNNKISGMRNHGIISSNSRYNTISANEISDSNEALFFYSEEVDRQWSHWLAQGDYRSHDNCFCGNSIYGNRIGIHLKDSSYNQLTNNAFQNNDRSILIQGENTGNIISGNSGAFLPGLERVALSPLFTAIQSGGKALGFFPQ